MRCLMLEFRRSGGRDDATWLCERPEDGSVVLRREEDATWSVVVDKRVIFDGCASARDAGLTAALLVLDRWTRDAARREQVSDDRYARALVGLVECDQAFESARLLHIVTKRIARLMERLPEPFPASHAGGNLPLSSMDKFNVLSSMDDAAWARWLAEIGAPLARTPAIAGSHQGAR